LDLPGGGLAAVEGIFEASPSSTVIVMAGDGNADDLLASVRAGAVGYLTANTTSAALRRVLRAVLADEAAIPRELVRDLILELRSSTVAEGRVTARESQILSMLRRGQSTADIAERLQISAVTVRRHISGLVHKLEVEDRAALTSAKPTARLVR
jgi:DNA-binding NarL/FixJ family response regulator